jgi:hypothetical protein
MVKKGGGYNDVCAGNPSAFENRDHTVGPRLVTSFYCKGNSGSTY